VRCGLRFDLGGGGGWDLNVHRVSSGAARADRGAP